MADIIDFHRQKGTSSGDISLDIASLNGDSAPKKALAGRAALADRLARLMGRCVLWAAVLLLAGLPGRAFTPTLSPSPTPDNFGLSTPTPVPLPGRNLPEVSVMARCHGQTIEVPVATYFGFDDDGAIPRYADGATFESLAADAPEVALSDDFDCEVRLAVYDVFVEGPSRRFYREGLYGLTFLEGVSNWRDLPSGRFLMVTRFTAARGADTLSGDAMIWLVVFPSGPISASASIYYDAGWHGLQPEMIWAHFDSIYADGFAAFEPLEKTLLRCDPPEILLTDDFDCRVSCSDGATPAAPSCTFFAQNGETLTRLEGVSDWKQLDAGRWLMVIRIHANRGEDYYSGLSMVWLIVP